MSDSTDTPVPDPAPASMISPTVASLLAANGTLVRGRDRRFYNAGATDSVAEANVLAAIDDGTAYPSCLDAKGDVFAIRAQSGRVTTAAMFGTAEAATEG